MKEIILKLRQFLSSTIDIGNQNCPELSNFHPYEFNFRGHKIKSMEGLLQGIKFKELDKQNQVFQLHGTKAKYKGKKSKWYLTQTLYFQGNEIKRDSKDYQDLLDEAFDCLFKNPDARKALLSTKNKRLIHSIGKDDIRKTVLTEYEFCSRLTNIRNKLKN